MHAASEKQVVLTASFTEFCERYSYYMLQGLLIFYLIDHFHIAQAKSASLVGTVIGVIFISSIVGGYIADKLLTYYIAACCGSVLLFFGVGCLAGLTSQTGLFFGLALISISTGLIKSNMASFIGQFYDKSRLSDSHRDFSFNLFYVGINIGAFVALSTASYLKDHFGFATAFYSSMVFIVVIIINLFYGFMRFTTAEERQRLTLTVWLKVLTIVIVYVLGVFLLLKHAVVADMSMFVAALLCIVILIKSIQKTYFVNVMVACVFFILSILFWSLYNQIFISILLFIQHDVSRQLFMWHIHSSQMLAIEPLAVIILGGVMGKVWLYFGNKGKPIHDIDKFNLSFMVMALSFFICYLATISVEANAKVPGLVFLFVFILLGVSDLALSAIGLSCVTKIAPKGYVALYMGIWLVTVGLGGKLAGSISAKITISDHDIVLSKINMANGFLFFIALAILGSIICFIARKAIIRAKMIR